MKKEKDPHPQLSASIQRVKDFEKAAKECDAPTRATMLSAWKEIIGENLLVALRTVDAPLFLGNIDNAIAIARDCGGNKESP